ncbi:MAG TPA: Rieske (2Fe-2S) protein [Trebonia sp.]|nr:Rieske (2Fe-2S) protein [Trebonia sp.]
MTQEPHKDSLATRRGVLAGVGLVGLAGAITACSGGSSSSSAAVADPATSSGSGGGSAATSAAASTPAAASSSAGGSSGGAASGALTATSDIPVGGGKIFDTQLVVVTQPSAGQYKAFSAVCTHMGCTVNQIANGRIDCPCHGSEYSIKDGAVLAGPAPRPLPAKSIKVTGDSIFLE